MRAIQENSFPGDHDTPTYTADIVLIVPSSRAFRAQRSVVAWCRHYLNLTLMAGHAEVSSGIWRW